MGINYWILKLGGLEVKFVLLSNESRRGGAWVLDTWQSEEVMGVAGEVNYVVLTLGAEVQCNNWYTHVCLQRLHGPYNGIGHFWHGKGISWGTCPSLIGWNFQNLRHRENSKLSLHLLLMNSSCVCCDDDKLVERSN